MVSARVSCVFILSLMSCVLLSSAPAAAQFRTVTVQNAPANPVPVKEQGSVSVAGSVSITGTPSVSVSNTPSVNVSNTPSVNVNNAPNVKVTNALTAPVPIHDVDAAQDQSFGQFVSIANGQSTGSDSSITLPACPTGQSFLARTFYAGTDLLYTDNTAVTSIGNWGVLLFTGQGTCCGGFTVPLTVFGNGAGSQVVTLPAGMPVGTNPTIEAHLLGGTTASTTLYFHYILTGRCGTPSKE